MPPVLSATLKRGITPELVSPNIWSTLPAAHRAAPYDAMARAYDVLIGNTVYNKLVWGNWSRVYCDVAEAAILDAPDGPILDCGCGSLIFTENAYRAAPLDRMILFDRSHGMMQRGARRLPRATFLQGDALALPFVDDSFALCVSWALAHIFGSASPLFAEIRRVAKPKGRVILSMLVLADRVPGDWVLPQLAKRGEIALPERAEAVGSEFAKHFTLENDTLRGNMLFLSGWA